MQTIYGLVMILTLYSSFALSEPKDEILNHLLINEVHDLILQSKVRPMSVKVAIIGDETSLGEAQYYITKINPWAQISNYQIENSLNGTVQSDGVFNSILYAIQDGNQVFYIAPSSLSKMSRANFIEIMKWFEALDLIMVSSGYISLNKDPTFIKIPEETFKNHFVMVCVANSINSILLNNEYNLNNMLICGPKPNIENSEDSVLYYADDVSSSAIVASGLSLLLALNTQLKPPQLMGLMSLSADQIEYKIFSFSNIKPSINIKKAVELVLEPPLDLLREVLKFKY
ncbi:MAG: hypothetical protein KDD58_15025 [Bdellovibrionales bacterium]|nr:hypothetical protein [Bdellovibrionales bacterium]